MRGTGSFERRQEFSLMASRSLVSYKRKVEQAMTASPTFKKRRKKRDITVRPVTEKEKKLFKRLGHLPTDSKHYTKAALNGKL